MPDTARSGRTPRLLVVDDDRELVEIMRENLADRNYEVLTASSGEEAARLIEEQFFDLLILDEQMGGMSGSQLLTRSRDRYPDIGAIFVSAHADLEFAVRVAHLGALDVLRKPVRLTDLFASIAKALKACSLSREVRFSRYAAHNSAGPTGLIGQNPAFQKTLSLVAQAVRVHSPVLVLGESGVGKELVAKAIHYQGPRADKPFIDINAGAIPHELLESELFGHRKGAFTGASENRQGCFEAADGGTLFLDEIGEMAADAQVRLLRVLEEKKVVRIGDAARIPVDVRVIAATNKNLREEVNAGRFRRDLYYRLAVLEIALPPLRERLDDIPLLAAHFVQLLSADMGKNVRAISPEAVKRLAGYQWPGNVRELRNIIERAVILTESDTLAPDAIQLPDDGPDGAASPGSPAPTFWEVQDEFRKRYFTALLAATGGNKLKAAAIAGMDRTTLYDHLKKLGID